MVRFSLVVGRRRVPWVDDKDTWAEPGDRVAALRDRVRVRLPVGAGARVPLLAQQLSLQSPARLPLLVTGQSGWQDRVGQPDTRRGGGRVLGRWVVPVGAQRGDPPAVTGG